MVEEKGYQGWTNHATWATALWIDNEEGFYNESRRIIREAADGQPEEGMKKYSAARALKEWMEEFLYEAQEKLGASLWSDLLSSAMDDVNWEEIAENWLEE